MNGELMMELDAQQQEWQEEFKAFVDREVAPHADRYDQQEQIPPECITQLAANGYLAATLPEQHGGRGMDMITYGLLCEQLGRSSCSVQSLVTVQNMVAQTILRWGSEQQKQRWLAAMASGEVIAAFALTEPNVGSDARNVELTATLEGESYVLNGRKKWISFGQVADVFLLLGQCDGQPCTFLVEKGTSGLVVRPIHGMLGFRASMLAELHLDDCQVQKGNLIGGVGRGFFPVVLSALNIGRYSVAWGCVGLAQACLDACIHHTSTREQFGVLLREHQLIQRMLADMIVGVRAARILCHQAGLSMIKAASDLVMEIMIAKYFASTMASRTANDAVQIHGAMGCSSERSVQRYFRDAKIMEIIEGTTELHQISIAKQGYRAYGG